MAKPKLPNFDGTVAIDERPRFATGASLVLIGFIATDGAKLNLLRVEIDALADVGGPTPHLGCGSFRYDPLPPRMVSHRRRASSISTATSCGR
jgi:hypothetical protein